MVCRRWFYAVFPVVFLLVLFPGRALPLEKSQVAKYSITVELKPFYPSEVKRYGLEVGHPYKFDLETLDRYMRALAYQKKRFSWSLEKRLFPSALHDRMVQAIAKHYSEARPDQRVVYTIKNSSGKTMLHGDTFLTQKGLHWRLTVLQGSRREIEDFSVAGENWRLVSRNNLAYFVTRRFENHNEKVSNWLVFNKVRPEAGRIVQDATPPARERQVETRPKSVKKRLQVLEELKQEGLISEQEYSRKRLEILDGL